MSRWTPLTNADGGVQHFSRPDGEGGLEILSVQDIAPILERNKAMQNHNDGYTADRSMRRAAFVPNAIIQKWLTEEGIDFWNPDHAEAVKRKLNSSDYAYLRTAGGRL